jgi:hypothetical protein
MPEMRITKHSAVMATSIMWLLLAAFTSVHQTQHLCICKHIAYWSYLCSHTIMVLHFAVKHRAQI